MGQSGIVLEKVIDYLKFGNNTYDKKFKLYDNSWTLSNEGFWYNIFNIPERRIFEELKKKQGMKSSHFLLPTFTFFQIYYRTAQEIKFYRKFTVLWKVLKVIFFI